MTADSFGDCATETISLQRASCQFTHVFSIIDCTYPLDRTTQIGNIIFGDLIGNIFVGIKLVFNLMNDYALQICGITPSSIDGIQNTLNVLCYMWLIIYDPCPSQLAKA
jgi:hypothetical protein